MVFLCLTAAHSQSSALILPANPKPNEPISVFYSSAWLDSIVRGDESVKAEILLFRRGADPRLIELPLFGTVDGWKGTLARADSDAQVLLFRFVAGTTVDDNNGRFWQIMIHGAGGKPVQGAHLRMASLLLSSGFLEFRMDRDTRAARTEMLSELQCYPSSWQAKTMLWDLALRTEPGGETNARIRGELDRVFDEHRTDGDAVLSLLRFYDQTGQERKASEIRQEAAASSPRGPVAERMHLNQVYEERDVFARAGLLERFLAEFPQHGPALQTYQVELAKLYIQSKEYGRLDRLMGSVRRSPELGSEIGSALLAAGKAGDAIVLAREAVSHLRSRDSLPQPTFLRKERWEKVRREKLGAALRLSAEALIALGRTNDAEATLEEAYGVSEGTEPRINELLAAVYLRNGATSKAMDLCAFHIKSGTSTDSLTEYFVKAYVRKNGSDKGLTDSLNVLRDIARTSARERLLQERIGRPSTDFLLKGVDGKRVKLSSFKGKIVVLGFWATWSASSGNLLTQLQKVDDLYGRNGRVKVLALNTREHVSGAEREMLVQKFAEESHCSFPILFDDGYADKCGVRGLPTRFVVDRDGVLQFKNVGEGDGSQVFEELTRQIELLLSVP